VGYAFDWGDLNLAYRALRYESGGKVTRNLTMYGPAFTATFHF
jgi:hypothetical protein